MKAIKLLGPDVSHSYAEVSQRVNLRFQLFSKAGDNEYKAESMPFKCMDFLVESVISSYAKVKKSIYGFVWNKQPFYNTDAYIRVTGADLTSNLVAIWDLEDAFGIPKTEVLSDTDNLKFIKVSKEWTRSPLLIHLYSFLFRSHIEFYEAGIPYNNFDQFCAVLASDDVIKCADTNTYRNHNVAAVVADLLINRDKLDIGQIKKEDLIEENVGTQHDNSGIKSLLEAVKEGCSSSLSITNTLAYDAIK